MIVEVSKDHLDKAVDIKLALQDISNRRCNWSQHQQMMEEEGFDNSDLNESYRCMIKDYQKEIGKLHSLPKHADLIASSKLDRIQQIVGEVRFEKTANQDLLREINKNLRELSRTAVLADEFRNILLDEMDFSVPHYVYNPVLPNSRNKGICIITDWHIGVVVNNCLGNNYNYEIAQKRVNKLKQEVLDYCRLYSINDLYVVGCGDFIEHISMRKNQSQDCEFGKSMQIAKAQKLILDFLVSLSEYVNITAELIPGNHDRENGDKTANFDGDNANVTINEGIEDMLELINSPRLQFIKSKPHQTSIELELNGKKFKFVHGDKHKTKNKHILKTQSSLDREFYDVFVHGHLHNWYTRDDDHGGMVVGVGCLMGRNNYSKEMECATDASQGMIVVREDSAIIPIPINLQII
ncbi:hypothetical protein ERL59_06545 [Chengkuizengella sp. YPA3-1-1]|uniref:Calcineurin-like phosphoesterase domain-containing protein n=2 Tax=Chengkuizengella marina TaxID=2507566 RepID=A0A6N9Q257_9BACL|nr:hypothetical protein [Chengkuizengella marina]